ncbi:MAG: tryptophan--tRNA ligase, partial [Dehalococcoidia bacterium]
GNYLGAIQNYVSLQDDYECIYCAVDIHALTSLEETDKLQENIGEMMLDWLAAGLDPERSILFVQSHVPQVMELHTLLSMVTPLSWLTRVATFKEKARMQPDNINYGLVGYPVLMTADIILYKADTFPEPQAKLSNTPLVLGLDGVNKMSKSYNNHIELAASPEETHERVMAAFTDPARRYRSDPGHPEVCNVYRLHRFYNPERLEELAAECRAAAIGCVDCKELLARGINQALQPFRERRAIIAARPGYVEEVLADGAHRACVIATETLREVKGKMGLISERK